MVVLGEARDLPHGGRQICQAALTGRCHEAIRAHGAARGDQPNARRFWVLRAMLDEAIGAAVVGGDEQRRARAVSSKRKSSWSTSAIRASARRKAFK